jgi:uncharacterized oxidoreductase
VKIPSNRLQAMVARIFEQLSCQPVEARRIAAHLVDSNLVGHDSHGVIRVPAYVAFARDGKVLPNQQLEIVFENECLALVDGRFGFGQVIGEQAVELGIAKSARQGVAVIALRNCGHLGRIGDWAEQAAAAGRVSLHFVNTSGAGVLVAPFGGIDRRLSANPIAAGIPRAGRPPIVLDISTCAIAEGKIKVAFNKGVAVPEGAIIDCHGQPTTDPRVFYADPPGAILPVGAHKGFGLGMITELLAGVLTGGGCSAPGVTRLSNGMLSIYLDPRALVAEDAYSAEIARYVEFVKSSRTVLPNGEILMPGEVEYRNKQARLAAGIELDDTTWGQLVDSWKSLGLEMAELDAVLSAGAA